MQPHPLSGNTIYSLNLWLFCCFFFYYALLLLVGIFFYSFAFLCSFLFMFFFLKIFLKNYLVILLLLVLYFIKIKLLPEFSIYCYCFPSVFIVLFHFIYYKQVDDKNKLFTWKFHKFWQLSLLFFFSFVQKCLPFVSFFLFFITYKYLLLSS